MPKKTPKCERCKDDGYYYGMGLPYRWLRQAALALFLLFPLRAYAADGLIVIVPTLLHEKHNVLPAGLLGLCLGCLLCWLEKRLGL